MLITCSCASFIIFNKVTSNIYSAVSQKTVVGAASGNFRIQELVVFDAVLVVSRGPPSKPKGVFVS